MADRILELTALVVEQSADQFRFKATLKAAEFAFNDGESGLLIGHCKSMIESMSKTILDEKGVAYTPVSNMGWLAKHAVTSLAVAAGVDNQAKARDAFKAFITAQANQIEIMAQSLGELRNDFCPLSHGRAANHIPLDMAHATFVARQTDNLLWFLYELYLNHKLLMQRQVSFTTSPEFNDYVNDAFSSADIFEDEYLPADILYAMNPEKYKVALQEWEESDEDEVNPDAE